MSMRIAVGEAHGPHRLMLNHSRIKQEEWNQGKTMDVFGWAHKMQFWGFSTKQPGTIRIAVGEAHGPHRLMVNHSYATQDEWNQGKTMDIAGWTHKMEFWVYPTKQPGTIRIAVGEAHGPHRIMLNHSNSTQDEWDEGKSMNTAGWAHKMEFWAYPTWKQMKQSKSAGNKSVQDISDSFAKLVNCNGSMGASDIFNIVGRGGVSRMILKGKPDQDLSSIGKFFEKGSTLGEATAFTNVAVSKANNVKPSSSIGAVSPGALKAKMLEAANPVDEMQFCNIGGTRVFYYYGLDNIKSAESIMDAGLHVKDTAIGVLMLDQYHINERPGDPSNPTTFWPYQVFYAAPQGVTFGECKKVGSAGSNALKEYPLQTTAICQAFQSMAEVAASKGYKRLIITGDCGFYSLAAGAYAKKLTCWGKQSWEPHPDGAFAGFCIPRFMCPSLDLEIILSMGTPQLISSADPTKNLVSKTDGASVIYLTADTCGFYGGDAKETVSNSYAPFLKRPWVTADCFNIQHEICMLDVVVRVNDSLLESIDIKDDPAYFVKIAERLVEFEQGSVAFLVGLFLGDVAGQQSGKGGFDDKVWDGAQNLKPLAKHMAVGEDGAPRSSGEVVLWCQPIFDYLRPLLLVLVNKARKMDNLSTLKDLTDAQEFLAYAVIVGNPAVNEEPEPSTWQEMKLAVALRMQDALLCLLHTGDLVKEVNGLPIGAAYADTYAYFNADLNRDVLSKVERSHGIDGNALFLFDCRYIPGFGLPVNLGNTVWTASKNYYWMGALLRRFAQIVQERGSGPVLCHLECTELFSFSPFLQEMGLPVVDAINYVSIASRCTDTPVRFAKFKQDPSTLTPRTPAALLGDMTDTSKYYRDFNVQVRSPTEDALYFADDGEVGVEKLLQKQKKLWKEIVFAQPLFDDFKLKWGLEGKGQAPPGDSLYAASCALDRECYVEPTGEEESPPQVDSNSSVQYALGKNDGDWLYEAFYDGKIYSDGL